RRRTRRPARLTSRPVRSPATTCSLSSAYDRLLGHSNTRYVVTPTPLARKVRRLYTGHEVYATPPAAMFSRVLERERLGQPRVAQRDQRLASHQPGHPPHEAPADRQERRDVEHRRTDALGMKRRHHLPVEIDEVHGQDPDAADRQRRGPPLDGAPHQVEERNPEVPRHQ